MGRNGDLVRMERMPEPEPLNKLLEHIEGFEVDGLSPDDKARLFKTLQKKLNLDSSLNVQTLGGSQIIGSSVQFYFSEKSSVAELVSILVEKLGKDSAVDIIRLVLEKL
jgi:hypothetical protein